MVHSDRADREARNVVTTIRYPARRERFTAPRLTSTPAAFARGARANARLRRDSSRRHVAPITQYRGCSFDLRGSELRRTATHRRQPNIDSHHEQAETLITIHGLIDHSHVAELSKKAHRGSEWAVLRGLHVGGTCYGYALVAEGTRGSKRLAINEPEAPIVQRIFEMSAAGQSVKGITRILNAERAGRRGNWCPTGIRSMLKRELYKGEVVWNRSKFEKVPRTSTRRRKMRDESERIRVPHPELAIVEAELRDRVRGPHCVKADFLRICPYQIICFDTSDRVTGACRYRDPLFRQR